MAKTVEHGIRKPVQKTRGTKVEKVIEYGIRKPSSDFDRRPEEIGPVTYVGPSKLGPSGLKASTTQKKKHKSTGRSQ